MSALCGAGNSICRNRSDYIDYILVIITSANMCAYSYVYQNLFKMYFGWF